MRGMRKALLLTIVVLTVLVPPAAATLVPAFSLRHLGLEADDVVHGEVVGEQTVYDPVFGRVYTHTEVRVREVVDSTRGSEAPGVGDVILVRQMGGVLHGLESRVVGTARLAPGAEVVIFCRTDGSLHYLVGMAQGAYGVLRAPGADPVLVRSTDGLAFVSRRGPVAEPAPDRLLLRTLGQTLDRLLGGDTP